MAKNRNKKKSNQKNGVVSMDLSLETTKASLPEAMDTSEGKESNPSTNAISRKIKGVPMKRSKKLKKLKALTRAITNSEKSDEKVSRSKNKMLRIQSAKSLYD